MADELKKGQKLQDMKPEARNVSETGWEGFDSSRGLFSASLYSLFPASALMDGKRTGSAGCDARKKTVLSCQKAALMMLF